VVHDSRPPDWLEMLTLIVITSREKDLDREHADVALEALHAGCRAIQFRDKTVSDRAFVEGARRIQTLCLEHGALFFVNDRVGAAAVLGCGVHLGVHDVWVSDARAVLGPETIIGFSPEMEGEAREAVAAGADYLGVGPVFVSPTKGDAGEANGVDGLSGMCRRRLAPVVAVGGIRPGNAAAVTQAGAAGVAVVSAVSRADDMGEAVREFFGSIEAAHREVDED
jgi:thiamine-phosphate diphosphorylase